MAITEYTQPADMQLIDTYTPIPFQELLMAGQAKQGRVEQGLAAADALETDLGTFDGLDIVQGAGGKQMKVGDRDRVQARVDQYTTQLGELSAMYQDPSSIEFRMGIKKIITGLRKDKSPTGVFGQAASNVSKYGMLQKQLTEAEQLGDRPHLAAELYQQLEGFASQSQQGAADLNVSGSIGEGINQQTAMADLMKNLTATYLGESFAQSGRVPGFVETKKIDEVSYADAYQTARNLIATNPDLLRDLELRQRHAGQTGRQFDATTAADDLAKTMAGLFKKREVSFSTSTDPFALAGYKKKLEDAQDSLLTTNIAVGIPATIYDTPENVFKAAGALSEQATGIEDEISTFVSEKGIEDPQVGIGADGVDYSAQLQAYNEQWKETLLRKDNLLRIDKQAREAVGITDDYIPSDKVLADAKKKSRKDASRGWIALGISAAQSHQTAEQVTGMTSEDYIKKSVDATFLNNIKDVDPKYIAYREMYKKIAGPTAENANAIEVPKKYAERTMFKDRLKLFAPNFEAASLNIQDLGTGASLNEKEFDKLNFQKGTLQSFIFDPADNGKAKLVYSVPTKEKEGTGANAEPKGFTNVKVSAPNGFDVSLIQDGYLDVVETQINKQLRRQMDGAPNASNMDITVGDSTTQLSASAVKDITTNKWTVTINTSDGKMEIPANSETEVISAIRTAYTTNIKALIKAQQNK